MRSQIDDNQLAIHAAAVLELTQQRYIVDAIRRNVAPAEYDGGLDAVLGMAEVRATDLLMIRNLV